MLGWLSEPFESPLVRNALTAGLVVTAICAIVGTWVVLRGAAFLGEAMSHGVLPGVALASVMGGNIVFGAMAAALAMAYGVSALGSSRRLSADTGIGLLLVGMLALGVIVVSHSRSHATDLTALLFGDVLAANTSDVLWLTVALVVIGSVAFVGRRAFTAATFDVRKAVTLGLHPRLATATLTVLMAAAIVASFRVVGTLLMLGLLVAPPAAAMVWARSVPQIMVGAAVVGSAAVTLGLIVSWHAGTAGGATIAATAVVLFFLSLALHELPARLRRGAVIAVAGIGLAGCSPASPPAGAPEGAEHNLSSPQVQELDDAPTRLIVADSATGATEVIDAVEETAVRVGEFGPVHTLVGDGRFGYLMGSDGTAVVDSGAWTFDHGDHNHYYERPPAVVGSADAAVAVTADAHRVALRTAGGDVMTLDRNALADGDIRPEEGPGGVRVAVPQGDSLIVATDAGELLVVDEDGCSMVMPVRCQATGGVAATRTATVLACRDGAVRVSGEDATAIPFPAGQTPELGLLANRGGGGEIVGLDGDQVWMLTSAKHTWDVVTVPGAAAANSAGDGQVLVLTTDGILRLFDVAAATQTAELALGAPDGVIEVDRDRAYVNDAAARAVYEIDYRDGLRLARTLRTTVTPDLMSETGR
ncbi:zinc ABC transporter permease AztB [Mycobacterium sp. MS1601]|uniref:zinc ABC transporter permease AztB n=1 Tax=Mycobacterium sp. MS1601 TaxID=1936029 RepID=UPI001F01A155|nr:zinc ABC transporter permease AztB [Mycobacterium sp. MS1601]